MTTESQIIEELVELILMQDEELKRLKRKLNRIKQYLEIYEEYLEGIER